MDKAKRLLRLLFGLALAASITACGRTAPADPTATGDPDNWPSWGRTEGEQHYSPLDTIDTGSVARLGLAWHYDLPSENTLTEPLEVDGKLFVTTGHSFIRAFEAATGKLLWEYDSHTREVAGLNLRMGWGTKGIAYWKGRIFLATTEGRIIALDANSGKQIWMQRDFDPKELRYINGAPRVFDGKLVIGHGGADISAIRGYATAYDTVTGKRLWRFYTVPGNPAVDHDETTRIAARTWNGEWWKNGGGGTVWGAFSYDPELKLIYIGVGNGYPYNQRLRSPGGGDNLFLASIVAVDADTGKYVWHYQVCPGEQWDCTATQDMTLATLNIGGKPRKVLMQAPKNGFFYVLDRKTGELLSAKPFARVTWARGIDIKTGRPIENPGIRYGGKPGMFELWPAIRGAHSWLPQSYSPRTGLVYLPVIEGGAFIGDDGVDIDSERKAGGMGVKLVPNPALPGGHRSFLKAWDPVAQKARWTVALPGDWPGGTMATAGDLVFQGRIDGKLVAYDARSGKELWSYQTGTPVVAPPITFRVAGKQYVTVLTGSGASGGGVFSAGDAGYRTDYRMPRRVLTFVLNGKDKLPASAPLPLQAPVDPGFRSNPALEAKGAAAFAGIGCIVCHGINAIGGGSAPDLRTSPVPADGQAIRAVLKGALVPNGMPAYPELADDQIEAIRQYLRVRGRQLGPSTASEAAKGKSFDGAWNLTVGTPDGTEAATATYRIAGDSITGQQIAPDGPVAIAGTVHGNRATWSGQVYLPYPVTLRFDVTLEGDSFRGTVNSSPFGTWPVSGKRR
ncbi:PQQ-dependent dehydrogenase, methanol/ethanol family [Novosphingobium sp. G106]|uniref:PQQ-dependent dehydrogenase, methanol/ethanol family n=1 Tax=Novosphingobium sp. G106 TaxID=2849500 RepID=UPI001C2D66B4|nr:PQQ-dependent dehydrogenase, methanol/ethanol family [Novosphingobium sp. G106]MBV1688121.1 PQQ-dependent dehydrogenase, methanol/ethanol family [Novosphingobium sp. G106]